MTRGNLVGQALHAQSRKQAFEDSSLRRARVTSITNWDTAGLQLVLEDTGETIYCQGRASGAVFDLSVGDYVWARRLVGGQRNEWIVVGFCETAGGSFVPSLRGSVGQISELYASDGSPQALDTDAAGDMTVLTNLIAPTFKLQDTGADNTLALTYNEDATADRVFNLVMGDADRTLTLSDDVTLGDWFDQSVKAAASPTFAYLKFTPGSAPGVPAEGDVYVNSTDHNIYFYNGTAWEDLAGAGGGGVTGSGTTSYIPKWTGSTSLGDSIVYDDGSNRIGIATTNPTTRLQIGNLDAQNTLKVTGLSTANMAPVISLFRSGTRELVIACAADGDFILASTAGLANYQDATLTAAAHLTIDTSGNVGIGTTGPSFKLDVVGQIGSSGAQAGLQLLPRDGTGNNYVIYNPTGDDLRIWRTTVGDRFIFTDAGSFRLSTVTTPGTPTEGEIYADADHNLYYYNGTGWDDLTAGGGTGLWTDQGTYIYANNYTSAVVTDTERFGIGTTNPLGKLDSTQSNASGAIPPLYLYQADVDQPLIMFRGQATTGLGNNIIAEVEVTTATRAGWLRIEVQDDGAQIASQDYFIPIYTLA